MMMEENYSLRGRNTFGFDSRVRYFYEYSSEEELRDFLRGGFLAGKRFFHMGGGSNLVLPSFYDGVMMHSCIKGIEVLRDEGDEVVMRVGAGEVWDDFVRYCVGHGLCGVENLSLIPGEVGASVVQNIGAYGADVKGVLEGAETVCVADGESRYFSASECELGYRDSVFKRELRGQYIVTFVHYRLSRRAEFNLGYQSLKEEVERMGGESLENVRGAVIAIRRSKLPDPKDVGSAGSFFMNPVVEDAVAMVLQREYPLMPVYKADGGTKLSAGWLIEQCGWKGKTLGHVGVYEKQALVLVNRGGGSGEEIRDLAQRIIDDVRRKFGVELKAEAIFV